MRNLLTLALGCALVSCIQTQDADLVVHNALIYTVDENFTTGQAMAVRDGRILEVGAEREILNRYSAAEKYDARTMVIYPGFIDAHSHFMGYARSKADLALAGIDSPRAMALAAAAFAEKSDREWVTGRGWDQNLWPGSQFPDRALLDSLLPDRPVLLRRTDGHAALVNAAAMKKAGLTAETKVPGGEVVLDSEGVPTGLLIDRAVDRVARFIPPVSDAQLVKLLKEAEADCFAAGLTTVSDAGISVKEALFLDSLQQAGELTIRIYAFLRPDDATKAQMRKGPILTERLTARSVKLYGDGAMGSRGALLKEPYSDDEGNYGLLLTPVEEIDEWAEACLDYGFQLNTHCIGDSANALVLRRYARQLEGMNDLRWRIEHAQTVSPEDRTYFADYGIIPSVQPIHAVSDGGWVAERLGEDRMPHAYAYESLRNTLGILALGTDFPVEGISPLENFRAAVFRNSENAPTPFQPEEALSPEHALRGMTIWAALASFEDKEKGSLEQGKHADFVLLNRDLMKVDSADAGSVRVMDTWVGGVRK